MSRRMRRHFSPLKCCSICCARARAWSSTMNHFTKSILMVNLVSVAGRFRCASLRERNCQIVGFGRREVQCKIGNKRFVFQLHSTWPSKPLVKLLRSSYIKKPRSNTSTSNRDRILCLSLVPAKDRTSDPKWKCWVSTSDCHLKRVNWRAQTECIPY